MHQAQHSISSDPQYPNDQHTTSTQQHYLEAHQGSWNRHDKHQIPTQPDPETTKCQEESIVRNCADSAHSAPTCLRAQSQPPESKAAFPHTEKEQGSSGTAPPWLRSPLSCSHNSSRNHQFTPHTNKYLPCNLKLVYSTGQEKKSLLSYSVFYTTG